MQNFIIIMQLAWNLVHVLKKTTRSVLGLVSFHQASASSQFIIAKMRVTIGLCSIVALHGLWNGTRAKHTLKCSYGSIPRIHTHTEKGILELCFVYNYSKNILMRIQNNPLRYHTSTKTLIAQSSNFGNRRREGVLTTFRFVWDSVKL